MNYDLSASSKHMNYIPFQIPHGKWQEQRSPQEKRAKEGRKKGSYKWREKEGMRKKKKEHQEEMEKETENLEKEQRICGQ